MLQLPLIAATATLRRPPPPCLFLCVRHSYFLNIHLPLLITAVTSIMTAYDDPL